MAPNSTLQRICSDNMRRLRTERGLTQAQMAQLVGISQQAYWALEQAKSSVTIQMLERIATVLEVHPGELLHALVVAGH